MITSPLQVILTTHDNFDNDENDNVCAYKEENVMSLFFFLQLLSFHLLQELALLGSGGKRTASIICRETTELFEIEKETFLEVCPDIFEKELNEKMDAVM